MIKNGEQALSFFVKDVCKFPAIKGDGKGKDYDANLLIVKILFFDGAKKRQTNPFLLTYELQELDDGIWSVINGKGTIYISEITEPYQYTMAFSK